jgi:hypothetical protein
LKRSLLYTPIGGSSSSRLPFFVAIALAPETRALDCVGRPCFAQQSFSQYPTLPQCLQVSCWSGSAAPLRRCVVGKDVVVRGRKGTGTRGGISRIPAILRTTRRTGIVVTPPLRRLSSSVAARSAISRLVFGKSL